FFKLEIEDRSTDDERCGDQLGLGGMQSEDMVLRIDPDLLDKEPFYSIDNKVNGKQGPGDFQPFAQAPEQEEQPQTDQGLIHRSGKNGDGELAAVLTIALGYPDAFADHIMRIGE